MIKVRRSDEKEMTTANLTSMTDVLLTLLIMFMVAETAGISLGFNMKLPRVIAVEKPDDPSILITYTKERNLFITAGKKGNDIKIQRVKLKTYLARLRHKFAYDQVIIKADRNIKYKEVISIMDDAKRAGYQNISLATEI